MKIITLVENTTCSKEYKAKHGLSFYIETDHHKILFDLGSSKLFLRNAKKLDVDITTVDTAIISHGHTDHGGALKEFLKYNQTAKVYIRSNAFEKHYAKILGIPISIGLNASILSHPQVILVEENYQIGDSLLLFSAVENKTFFPQSNQSLFVMKNKKLVLDDFSHEQSLVVRENGKSVLFSGCAHSGIANIQEKAENLLSQNVDIVFSGMHLFNPMNGTYEADESISNLGKTLAQTSAIYYTCHCTGEKALPILKNELGTRIKYISTGMTVTI